MLSHQASGRQLRYLLTLTMYAVPGPMTVRELVGALQHQGVTIAGRPSKAVSDALRWEIRRGRVVKVGRGQHGRGRMPRSTAG